MQSRNKSLKRVKMETEEELWRKWIHLKIILQIRLIEISRLLLEGVWVSQHLLFDFNLKSSPFVCQYCGVNVVQTIQSSLFNLLTFENKNILTIYFDLNFTSFVTENLEFFFFQQMTLDSKPMISQSLDYFYYFSDKTFQNRE